MPDEVRISERRWRQLVSFLLSLSLSLSFFFLFSLFASLNERIQLLNWYQSSLPRRWELLRYVTRIRSFYKSCDSVPDEIEKMFVRELTGLSSSIESSTFHKMFVPFARKLPFESLILENPTNRPIFQFHAILRNFSFSLLKKSIDHCHGFVCYKMSQVPNYI